MTHAYKPLRGFTLDPGDILVTADEAAQLAHVTLRSVKRWTRDHGLTPAAEKVTGRPGRPPRLYLASEVFAAQKRAQTAGVVRHGATPGGP